MYRTRAVTLIAQELATYRLDLIGPQDVRLARNSVTPIGDCYTIEKEIIISTRNRVLPT